MEFDYAVFDNDRFVAGIKNNTHTTAGTVRYVFKNIRLIAVTQGKAVWTVANEPFTVSVGNILVLNNISARRITEIINPPLEYTIIEFNTSLIQNENIFSELFYPETGARVINPDFITKELLAVLIKLISAENFANPQTVRSLIHTLLLSICSNSGIKEKTDNKKASVQETISLVCDYIQNHPGDDLSTQALAQKWGYSRGYFSKMFHRYTGTTLNEYINLCRADSVARILQSSNINVLTAAETCGFRSSSGFYKAFARVTGTTPGEYIKKGL